MDGRKGKDKNTGNNNESSPMTSSDGFIPEFSDVRLSQCVSCKNSEGVSGCKRYIVRPKRYQFRSCGLKCPHFEKR